MSTKKVIKRPNHNLFISIIVLIPFFAFVGCSSQQPARKIVKGEGSLVKSLFYQNKIKLKEITDIIPGPFDEQPGDDIGIFSDDILHIVDPATGAFKSKRESKFFGLIDAFYKDNNGNLKLFNSSSFNSVVLINELGKSLWSYELPKRSVVEIEDMDAGDIDRDRHMDFLVATYSGLYRFDESGEKIWFKEGWLYDVEIIETDEKNIPKIITRSQDNNIQFRDSQGKITKEMKPIYSVIDMAVVNWQNNWRIVATGGFLGCSIFILDLDGKIIMRDREWYEIYEFRVTPVKFYEDQKSFLAVVCRLSARFHRSILYVYTPNGKLFYKEIIGSTTGLLAKKVPDSNCETLLVGDEPGMVYEYKPK